ncbi:ARMC4 [Bugula neritina]|uniref:ARMC4 n=1 Tax=Bugula neritina TaxID=10212 RepID=A0A7J7KT18_BUGNE|nr:ARMC4 [Bugula neritina]
MGLTIGRARKGTSAADGGSRIPFNAINENLLNKIIDWVTSYAGAHPEESKLKFKSTMTWSTSLKIEDFSGGAFEQRGDDMVSTETIGKENTPCIRLHKDSDGLYKMSVQTVAAIVQVLNIARDRRLDETRACLEANPDPTAVIAGDRFSSVKGEDLSTYRYMQEIMKEGDSEEDTEQKRITLKLVMHIQKQDVDLLQSYAEAISGTSRPTPFTVEGDVALIKEFCGEDEDVHVLEDISFTTDHKFDNHCRSPPWRQILGDIAYIEVKPHDEDPFFITASTTGYFVNKGWVKEKCDLDYEPAGEVNSNLVELLKTKSAKFAELIVRQPLESRKQQKAASDVTMIESRKDDANANEAEREKEREMRRKEDEEQRNKGRKETKKHLEPTLKWIEESPKADKKKKVVAKADAETKGSEAIKPRRPLASRGKSKTPYQEEDSFSESSSESEEEEEVLERRQDAGSDLPSDYWQIQKLVKYLKGGNQTATIIALCAMRDFNLNQETIQLAIRDVGGLEVLINLLDTEDIKCKIGALNILKYISKNAQIRKAIADLGGLQTMVKILRDPNKQLKALSAETIANVAKFRRARRTVRQHGGIRKLVGLLDCAPLSTASTPEHEMDVEVARCGALALWSCSKSTKNKQAMRKAGAIPLLARLLKSTHESMLVPVVGTLQECASEPSYRLAIRTEGMIEDLVTNLKSENAELQMHCASAIFKCAEEKKPETW